jgi:26S proteasome regulatory subunit N13
MNLESLASVLNDPDRVQTLQQHLPTIEGGDENMTDQLRATLTSPQFQQAMSTFSSALQSGQLGPVVSQFKLSSEAVAAANSGDLEQFVKALEKSVGAAAGKTGKASEEEAKPEADKEADTKGDDEMKLD